LKEETVSKVESYRQWKRADRQRAEEAVKAERVAAGEEIVVPD